jgi:glycosyltransferase involved in cell wall biosynthesis
MHILQVVHQFPPERLGGTEIYTLSLSRALAGRGHQVTVVHGLHDAVNCPPLAETARVDGLRVFRFQPVAANPLRLFIRSFDNPPVEAAFTDLLRQLRPDVVHFQHLKGLSARLVGISRRAGLPAVWTLHDYWAFCGNAQLIRPRNHTCGGPRLWLNCADCAAARVGAPAAILAAPGVALLFAYRDRLLRQALAQASLLIAPSAFVRARFLQQGFPPGRLLHVDHGIDLPPAPVVHRPDPDGRLRCVFLGGLARQKGVHVLVQAFNGLDPNRASLTIYGDETVFPDYVRTLKTAVRHPGIRFGGQLPRERLWEVLADADVLAIPSLWFETSSLVAQEAFAAGVPVVASALGALTERVRDGVDGLLVPPGDVEALRAALSRLIAAPDLLAGLRTGIRPVTTIDEHVAEIEAIYQRLAGATRASPLLERFDQHGH